MIQGVGFGPADLGFRQAETIAGPWGEPERFCRPEEVTVPQVIIYATKAHPHPTGTGPHLTGGPLVLTDATNSLDYRQLVSSNNLYYPRFLRVEATSPSHTD